MPGLSRFIPEGRARQRYDELKARLFQFLVPEGPKRVAWRLKQLERYPSIWIGYLVSSGETSVMVGSPHPRNIELMARCVGRTGRTILIEPERQNLERHRAHFDELRLNVDIVPKAAYNTSGKAKFLVAPHPADHRLVIPEIEHDNDYRSEDYYIDEIDMEVDTVDNIMDDLGVSTIDHITIMVNGAELHILEGMERMLPKTKQMLIKGHARFRDSQEPLHKKIEPFLQQRGFNTKVTLPSKAVARTKDWGDRDGDVFAWRPTRSGKTTSI